MMPNSLISYSNVPYFITGVALFILFLLVVLKVIYIKQQKEEEKKFLELLQNSSNSYANPIYIQPEKKSFNWNKFWGKKLKQTGLVNKDQEDARIGLGMIVFPLLLGLVVGLLAGNIMIGIFPLIACYVIINILAAQKIKQKQKEIDNQIIPFIGILKANIQSNATPERALEEAINAQSGAIYDELVIAKRYAATANLSTALLRLREETSVKDIKFLCSCIELSSKLGTNLETQLEIIEKIIVDRKELEVKLQSAIRENQMLLYVMSAIIPFLLMYTYSMDESAKMFWFTEPLSWVVLIAIGIIYGTAVFLTNKFIKGLDKYK